MASVVCLFCLACVETWVLKDSVGLGLAARLAGSSRSAAFHELGSVGSNEKREHAEASPPGSPATGCEGCNVQRLPERGACPGRQTFA